MTKLLGRDQVVDELTALACDGETVLVFGPLGIGKTSILGEAVRRLRTRGTPCGLSPRTATFQDLVRGLEAAYPGIEAHGRKHRQLRYRLRLAVESCRGVLVLDHFSAIGSAAKGFLRYAKGLGLGILIGVDVENPRDHVWLRNLRLSHREFRVPPLPPRDLERILGDLLAETTLPHPLQAPDASAIVDMAQGRPGWIVQMVSRLEQDRYWSHGKVLADLLGADVAVEAMERYIRPL